MLKSQCSNIKKARDAGESSSGGLFRKVSALEARVRMLRHELNSLKRRDSASYILILNICKVADAQGNITNLLIRLHRSTVSFYNFNCRNVAEDLVEVSKRLKEAFIRRACRLQRGFRDAVRAEAETTRGLFAGAPGAVDKCLEVFVVCAN